MCQLSYKEKEAYILSKSDFENFYNKIIHSK